MRILVTGSSGHLGHALTHTLSAQGHDVLGIDIVPAPWTRRVGSITDRTFVHECMCDVTAVVHAATLHKPHVATHSRRRPSTAITSPNWAAMRPPSLGAMFPTTRTSTRAAAGGCFRRWIAFMSTNVHVRCSDGSRASTSPLRSHDSTRIRTIAANSRASPAQRAITQRIFLKAYIQWLEIREYTLALKENPCPS
jgi:hypothetical protein